MLIADACAEPMLTLSASHVKPVLEQQHEIHDNPTARKNAFHNEVTEKTQGKGNIVRVKKCTGSSQDISQISGPEEKSKPTPLSQIGFRDPASVGGGQQLTLLSIEVAQFTFLSLSLVFSENAIFCLRMYSTESCSKHGFLNVLISS